MFNTYLRWNLKSGKWLWIIVIIGLLACVPLVIERIQTEQSSKQVEIVYDYADLLTISDYHHDPQAFIAQSLVDLKQAGVNSIAIYESSLADMQQNGRLQVLNPREALLISGEIVAPGRNYTFVLFQNEEWAETLIPIIKNEFVEVGIGVQDWPVSTGKGLMIEAPYSQANALAMAPDPILISELQDRGFTLAARISDKRPLSEEALNEEFQMLKEHGVTYFIFAGTSVTGSANDAEKGSLTQVAQLMEKHGLRAGIIETDPSKPGQKGIAKLAYLTDYDVVRLHSIGEVEMFQSAKRLSDRMLLAVTDRNIRMIYINGAVQRDADTGEIKDTIHNTIETLSGEHGAIKRIEEHGYPIGTAEPFTQHVSSLDKPLKLVSVVGATAVIALLIGMFFPWARLAVYAVGLVGAAGLYVLSPILLLQALALSVSISAPSLALIIVVRKLTEWGHRRKGFNDMEESGLSSWIKAVVLLVRAVLISFVGIVYTVGLLNSITYMLAIDLFRGVSLLKLAPIAIVAVYYVLFRESTDLQAVISRVKVIVMANIKVVYVVIIGAIGIVGLYYLSRAGNTGSTLPGEQAFRAFLENTIGVRPRTQEFLIGHPLFILGAYAYIRYRKGLFILLAGIIGLLNVVNTFSHIHTQLEISGLRVAYGVGFGIVVSVVLVLITEILVRSWRRWSPMLKQL